MYIYRRVSDPELTEDLASLVFVKALEAEQAGKGSKTHVKGWLFRIAHNLIIDHYRRRERERKRIVSLEETPAHLCASSGPESEIEAGQSREWLQQALGRLGGAQAEVISLRNDGYEFEEIAASMGKSEGAVKAMQHRGLLMLRRLFAQQGTAR